MSALTDAAFTRLGYIGAIPVNISEGDARMGRARGLILAAAERVRTYLNLTDAGILLLSADLQGNLAQVVAEMAAVRLKYNAAPSTEEATLEGFYASSLLTPRFKRELDDLFRPIGGSTSSFVLERDEASSFFRPYDELPTL